MNTAFPKSAKRALSLIIAFAMLVGTLFVANVGVSIKTDAETPTELKISYWDGTFERTSNFAAYTYNSGDTTATSASGSVLDATILNETNAAGTEADPIIIDDAKEFATLVRYSQYNTTAGLYFKLTDEYDAFIMQPQAAIDDPDEFLSLSDGAATKAYFEDETRSASLVTWDACCGNGTFGGSFDGNGVEIYGVYVSSNTTYAATGLFGCVDPGVLGAVRTNDSSGAKTYNDPGNTFKNIILKSSYMYGQYRMGGITASSNGPNYGCSTNGVLNYEGCIVANCYMYCSGYYNSAGRNVSNNGLIMAYPDANDTVNIKNCLVYGNETYNAYSGASFGLIGLNNTYANASSVKTTGTLEENLVINSSSLYSNGTAVDASYNNYTGYWSIESFRGAVAKAWAPALDWGDSDGDGCGWYESEGEYPTPIKPDGYTALTAPDDIYAGGTGVKGDPYIIRTVDQLNKMVTEESYSSTYTESAMDYSDDAENPTERSITSYRSKYYKVADDVDALYINRVTTQEEANELYTSGAYMKWAPADLFAGNFDGNGVTIYGLMNAYGFVKKLDGTFAAIQNVHFKAAHIESGDRAAVVTTNLGVYGYGYKPTADSSTVWFNRRTDPETGESVNHFLISNISVTESYIKSAIGGTDSIVASAGGILSFGTTPPDLTVTNCMYDGVSSTLVDASADTAGASADSMKAGIVSIAAVGATNRWYISNCVSINEYPVSMKSGVTYDRFTANAGGGSCTFGTMYGLSNNEINLETYPKFAEVITLDVKDTYSRSDAYMLDWATTWQLVEVENSRTIPMPAGISNGEINQSYSERIAAFNNYAGATDGAGVTGLKGRYGWGRLLQGSGTSDDPYLITNALELAQAVGCGGSHAGIPLYYKLACDIDASGSTWVDQTSIDENYHYVEFIGTIDGDGYAVYGVAAVDENAAGFVPVLAGGTLKNIHFRNCYAGSANTAGIAAGSVTGGVISGCSVENCTVAAETTSTITGDWGTAQVTNSYIYTDGTATYCLETANVTATADSVTDLYSADKPDAVWYRAGDDIARHTSFAKAHTVTDIDGDGIVEDAYVTNDIIALVNHLLDSEDYANIYGDVNQDGSINISDLAVLRRSMSGSYNVLRDGFWRNVQLGKFAIYYDENDNYDFARKLQLYLETVVPGLGVNKYVPGDANGLVVAGTLEGTPETQKDSDTYIEIKTDTSLSYNQYNISLDPDTLILTISGGSFTAVEQAVNEFIAQSEALGHGSEVYTTAATQSILGDNNEKAYRTVTLNDGSTVNVYYAWGDEFNGESDDGTATSFNPDTWLIRKYRGEPQDNVGETELSEANSNTRYLNLESTSTAGIPDLWEVKDGKLTIWRGISSTAWSDDYAWGYKSVEHTLDEDGYNDFDCHIEDEDIYLDPGLIQTSQSMMFKQGYAEMRAALPHDGHAFPAWWFMTGSDAKTTTLENYYLYSKVYKLNNSLNNSNSDAIWDGVSMTNDPTNLSTYKYQMPLAYLELDIVEFMQAQSGKTGLIYEGYKAITTGDYRDYIQLTIHKYYNSFDTGGSLYLPNWSTGTYFDSWNGVTQTNFVNTASSGLDGTTFIHRYNPDTTTSPYAYTEEADWLFQDDSTTSASYSISQAAESNSALSGKYPSNEFTYGFYWTVDEANSAYDLYVYVDFDEDTVMEKNEIVFHLDETNGHESEYSINGTKYSLTDPIFDDKIANDAEVWNQYAYMLLDNLFYTSNPFHSSAAWGGEETSGVKLFTDLLTKDYDYETTTFEIDYVRVYQEDNKRDIITPDTEAFNTGNHFGY